MIILVRLRRNWYHSIDIAFINTQFISRINEIYLLSFVEQSRINLYSQKSLKCKVSFLKIYLLIYETPACKRFKFQVEISKTHWVIRTQGWSWFYVTSILVSKGITTLDFHILMNQLNTLQDSHGLYSTYLVPLWTNLNNTFWVQ